MPRINPQEVREIAALARLRLDDDEILRLANELDGILGYIETVKGLAQEESEIARFGLNARRFRDAAVHQGDVEARFIPWLLLGIAEAAGLMHALLVLGIAAGYLGDHVTAATALEESIALCQTSDDRWNLATALCYLADGHVVPQTTESALTLLDESLALSRELEDKHGIARALISLGFTALRSGDYHLAKARLEEASGQRCLVVPYQEMSMAVVRELAPAAIATLQPNRFSALARRSGLISFRSALVPPLSAPPPSPSTASASSKKISMKAGL